MANHNKREADAIVKQFDIVRATDDNHQDLISDHYFFSSKHDSLGRKATSYIMREWSILKDSLPKFIYVRAYEERIDLLTAVIIGRPGTPFHQGLFIFDIQFTSDYPNSHPKLNRRFLSGFLNPSLNSYVCFKPLGHEYFVRDELRCSILRILLGVRVNVITSKPEPIYSGQSGRILPTYWGYWMEKEYLTFDQDMFMLNCQTMLAVLRKPPKHLEEFVAQHFRHHAESILIACKPYIDFGPSKVDADVSDEDENCIQIDHSAFATTTTATNEEWEEYKKAMRITYVELVKAFINNGSKITLENYEKVGDYSNTKKHPNFGFWALIGSCFNA